MDGLGLCLDQAAPKELHMDMLSGVDAVADCQSLIEFWFGVQHFLRVRARNSGVAGLYAREYETLLVVKATPVGHSANVALISERLCLRNLPQASSLGLAYVTIDIQSRRSSRRRT